jgi:hypothetical protein
LIVGGRHALFPTQRENNQAGPSQNADVRLTQSSYQRAIEPSRRTPPCSHLDPMIRRDRSTQWPGVDRRQRLGAETLLAAGISSVVGYAFRVTALYRAWEQAACSAQTTSSDGATSRQYLNGGRPRDRNLG